MDLISESIFQAQADKFVPQNIPTNTKASHGQENPLSLIRSKSETIQVNPAFGRAEFNMMLQRFQLSLPTRNRGGDALKLFHLILPFRFAIDLSSFSTTRSSYPLTTENSTMPITTYVSKVTFVHLTCSMLKI